MTLPRKFLLFLALSVIAFSFVPILRNGFVSSDDSVYVVNNPLIRDLSWHGLANIFGSSFRCMYHPLVLFSYAIEYHFFGSAPLAYQATNLALHLLNSLLVFIFIYKLRRDFAASLLIALFFGIHPLHVESVAYITERKDMLYSCFFLGSVIFYLNVLENKNPQINLLISLVFFVLSLMAKPAGFVLPFVLWLCDFVKKEGCAKKIFLNKIPYFLIASFFGVLGILNQQSDSGTPLDLLSQWVPYTFHSILFYISKLFIPLKLSFLYPLSEVLKMSPLVLGSGLAITSILIILTFYLKKAQDSVFGCLFFLITLIPSLEIMPINIGTSLTPVFDHYTYIPSIGIFYLLAIFLMALYDKKGMLHKIVLWIGLAALILGASLATWDRCHVWKDGLTLYRDALKKYPDNERAKICYEHLLYYQNSVARYTRDIENSPGDAKLYFNRAVFHSLPDAGNYLKALEDYDRAIALDPHVAEFYLNRGSIYQEQNRFEKALTDYDTVVRLDADLAQVYFNRGQVFEKVGQKNKAGESYDLFLKKTAASPDKSSAPGVKKAIVKAKKFSEFNK